MKLVEFLYFYLMPETVQPKIATSATNTAVLGGRGREIAAAFADHRRRETLSSVETKPPGNTRTTDEKQSMLGKYLNNVADLVEDLNEGSGPFAAAV